MKKNSNSDHPLMFKIVMLAAGLIAGFVTVKVLFLMMTVNTESMTPSLRGGDKIVISRLSSVKNGDIAAYYSPAENGRILISRIIASEYQTVEIRNKEIFVDEKKIVPAAEETREGKVIYPMKFCYRDNMPPVRMERNEFFMLGDNFDRSFDSRSFGKIPGSSVIGKIVYKR